MNKIRLVGTMVVAAGVAILIAAPRTAGATSPAPPEWTVTIEESPSASCIEVTSLKGETNARSYPDGIDVFRIRNRCAETFEFDVASCQRTECADAAPCEPVDCSGGPYRVQPIPDGGLSDTATQRSALSPDGGADAMDRDVGDATGADGGDAVVADADSGSPDGDAADVVGDTAPSDTSDGDGYEFDTSAIEVGVGDYALRHFGLNQFEDFSNAENKIEVTFDWRLDASRSGTFQVEIEYYQAPVSPPRPGPCGCTSIRNGGLPVAPWAVFAVGLWVVRWRRE